VTTTTVAAVAAAGGAALTIVYVVLAIALGIVGLLLTVMVLFQDSKSGGLAGAFGGAGATTYGEQTSRRIVKTTALLGGIFLGTLFLMAVLSELGSTGISVGEVEEPEGAGAEPAGADGTVAEPARGGSSGAESDTDKPEAVPEPGPTEPSPAR
jgi:protein translocase SecG subunit